MFQIKKNVAYICDDALEVDVFLRIAHESGIKWMSGDSIPKNVDYSIYVAPVFILTDGGLGFSTFANLPQELRERAVNFKEEYISQQNIKKCFPINDAPMTRKMQISWLRENFKEGVFAHTRDSAEYAYVTEGGEVLYSQRNLGRGEIELFPSDAIFYNGDFIRDGNGRILFITHQDRIRFYLVDERGNRSIIFNSIHRFTKLAERPKVIEQFYPHEAVCLGREEYIIENVCNDILRVSDLSLLPATFCKVKKCEVKGFDKWQVHDYVKSTIGGKVYEILDKTRNTIGIEIPGGGDRFYSTPEHFTLCTDEVLRVDWDDKNAELPQVCDEETKSRLVDICKNVFLHAEYSSDDGVELMIDKWAKQKAALAQELRKDPDWDEENLCVVKDISVDAKNDARFAQFNFFLYEMFCATKEGTPAHRITKTMFNKSLEFATSCETNSLTGEASSFISNICEENNLQLKIPLNVGAKFTRVINALMHALVPYGGPQINGQYEKEFAKFSDAMKTNKEKRRFVLSIHPADYLRMSCGNTWTSCHYLDAEDDSKCYQAGTISYMLDSCSMVGYVVRKDCTTKFWEDDKIFRQMYMYNGVELLKSRLYPDHEKDGIYGKAFCECVKKILKVPDDWQITACADTPTMREHSLSSAYPDFKYSNYNTYSFVDPKYYTAAELIINKTLIGAPPICPLCGEEHTQRSTCYCENCE